MCEKTDYIILTKEILLPSLAILISFIAVIFTALSLYIQRVHNIKSIKPIGKIRIGDYESDIYIRIDNSGIGPLTLKKVYLNEIEIPVNKMLLERIPIEKRKNIKWRNFSGNYQNQTIPVGDYMELIRWTPKSDLDKSPEELDNTRRDLRDTFQNWNLKIEYTDIYESQTFSEVLSLSWFGRHNK